MEWAVKPEVSVLDRSSMRVVSFAAQRNWNSIGSRNWTMVVSCNTHLNMYFV